MIIKNPNIRLILITIELNSSYKDYSSLDSLFKSSKQYRRIMENTWLLYTSRNIKFWDFNIRKIITKKDKFFIVDVSTSDAIGLLSKETWDWIYQLMENPDEVYGNKINKLLNG